jgi:hypothetical protein
MLNIEINDILTEKESEEEMNLDKKINIMYKKIIKNTKQIKCEV